MCGGNSYGTALAKEVLLFHGMGCSDVLECHRHGLLGLAGLSSSELLNTQQQHTGLQCTGCCSAVVSGVVGLKDKFSLVETW